MGHYDELKNIPWSTWEPLVVDDAVSDLIKGIVSLRKPAATPPQHAAFSLAATGMLVGDIIRTAYWKQTAPPSTNDQAISRVLISLKPFLPSSSTLGGNGISAIKNSLLRRTATDTMPDNGPIALKMLQTGKHEVFHLSRTDLRERLIRQAMPEPLPFETCMTVCTRALTFLANEASKKGITPKDIYNLATTSVFHAYAWSGQKAPKPPRRKTRGSNPKDDPA